MIQRVRLYERLIECMPNAAAALDRSGVLLELIASLELVDIDAVVLDRASQPMPTELGTLDAVHLATAVLWKDVTREELTMATYDSALALAAQAHGLPVIGEKRN